MTTKLLHVVSSLDSPAVEKIIAIQESRESHATICSVESPRPRRRRRPVSEVMTVMDAICSKNPHALDNELRRLDQKVVDERRSVLSRLRDSKIEVVSAERRHRFDVTTAMRLRRLLRSCQPDAVQTWDDEAARWVTIAGRYLSVPVSDSVAATSTPSKIDRGRIRIDRSHALTRSEFLNELRLPDNAKLIGAIGPLIAQRRIKDLIWAMELLRIVHDDTYLLIAGVGPEEWRLHRFRDQVGIRHRVRILGNRRDHQAWLRHLNFFWAGSKRYDDPRFVAEAMAAGVPVVATEIPDHYEIVTSEVDGYLVKPGDRAAFARHTWRMLNDEALTKRIGEAGRMRAETFAS
ncbi:glycosyltransferase [Planctomycetota bacterium]